MFLTAMNTETKSERDFSTVVAFSSALAFGAMLAVLQALRVSKSETSFDFSIWTAISFLVGSSSLFAYLRLVFTCGKRTPRAFRYGGIVVLGIPGRVKLIEEFIKYAQKQRGIVFMRKDDIAKWTLSAPQIPHEG